MGEIRLMIVDNYLSSCVHAFVLYVKAGVK